MSAAATPRDYAAEALDALRLGVLTPAPALKAEVDGYARALRDLHDAAELVPGMEATVAVVLAAEAVAKAAGAVEAQARDALMRCIEETGAPGVMTHTHTAGVQDSKRAVVITDPVALPRQYWSDPKPDKDAISKALHAGQDIPGAVLANTKPHLKITPRKKA